MPTRALLYRRPTEPQALEVYFSKAIYLVRLRRHRQARRYTLRIHNATREVVLTIPPRGSLKEAQDFAQKHGGWIAARLHRLPEAAPFSPGTVVPLRGVSHRIVHRGGARGTVARRVFAQLCPNVELQSLLGISETIMIADYRHKFCDCLNIYFHI